MNLNYNDIYYTKVGSGPHLCFLHGFCESGVIWDKLTSSLQEDYTCIAIDLPGFGKSSELSFGSLPEIANQVNRLLEHEQVELPILFGHSMGGYILAQYLKDYGDTVKAAGFIHSTLANDSEIKKNNRTKTINFIRKNGTKDFFKVFVPSLVASSNLAALETTLKLMVTKTKTSSIIQGLEAMRERPDFTQKISNMDIPILYLRGEEDEHYPKDEVYKQASNCQLVQISNLQHAGHLSMYEQPDECLRAVKEFLGFIKKLIR